MAKQRLTDRIITNSVGLNDLIHIVKTGDTSQNPAGSSYATTIGNIVASSSGSTVSGLTFNNLTYDLTLSLDNGVNFIPNLGILASDIKVTGGTYNPSLGEITFVNNSGGTFIVSGITSNFLSLSGGTVTGTTYFSNGLSANTISATTIGSSGNCVTDLYVSNIHSCSPLNINPLDEGNVYFGSTSGVTIDVLNSRLGVGTTNPHSPLEVIGTNGLFTYDPTVSGGRIQVSGGTGLPRITMTIPNYLSKLTTGVSVGIRSWDDLVFYGYGKQGDSFLYAGQSSNGLNIISDEGTNSEDYIRFYAGLNALDTEPDIHIQGTGTTRGFVGVGVSNPTAKFHINNTSLLKSFIVEDSTSPDPTPFVIDSNGSVSIGTTNVFSVGAGLPTSLNITSSGPSGVSYTGLGVSTPLVVESSIGASIAVLSPNTANSQIYFGTPSDAFGSYLRWDYTNRNLVLSTANSTGKIVLQTNNGIEAARILSNGDVGIGTNSPTTKLEVNGKTKTINLQVTSGATNGYVLTSDASGNASWQPSSGGGSGTTVTAFTYSDNNFTLSQVGESDLIANISVMTGLTINGNFNVNGNSVLSGSGQNVLTIIGSGTSTSSPLFSVQGSSGELFSISDNLIGELFSVNDISGLPVLRAFDDDTVLIGSYQAPSLHSSVRVIPSIGLTTVYTLPLSAYTGAWFDYTVKNTTGARAGQIMSIFSGSSVNFTETTTTDFGSTTPITFNFISDGTNASLRVSATTSNWEVKIIVRSI